MQYLLSARFLLLLITLVAGASAQDAVAWAWVNPAGQGTTFTPAAAYQFTPSGAAVTVDRVGPSLSQFMVTMPGAGPATGVVHATAYGGNHVAVVDSWWLVGGTDVRAQISLYTPSGGPANNGAFTIRYERDGDPDDRRAYLWADQDNVVSYTPNVNYSWNGNRSNPWINRAATGYYYVYLYDLAATGAERGHVQVTPYSSFHHCKVADISPAWGSDVLVTVNCFDAAGNLTDGRFVLSYHEAAAPIPETVGSGAHVRTDDATSACHVPDGYFTDSNGLLGPAGGESVCRVGVGAYRVHLPNLAPSGSSTAQVTTYDTSSPEYASIGSWGPDGCGGTEVMVHTWDVTGSPADARFQLLYLTNRPVVQRAVAWAWVNPNGQGATFAADAYYQWNSEGGAVTVDRFGSFQHMFEVRLPNMAPQTGIALVSAVAANHTAVVMDWWPNGDDVVVLVGVFQPNGAPANDAMFNLMYRRGGSGSEREAYLYANLSLTPSYTPALAWNADRPAPIVTRLGVGRYRASFPGLAPTGAEQGHVQVTPVSNVLMRAKVESWSASPFATDVLVRCTDAGGTLVDCDFMLHYNEVAAPIFERSGSGAHVWAGSPTIASYTPNPAYTDSNGTLGPANAETITRIGTGRYRVELPDMADQNSVTAQVTAYGAGPEYATVFGFGNGTGSTATTNVVVHTYDASGALADAAFTLLYLTNRPHLRPATNIPFGNGCNGPTLTALSKPALCRDWNLYLDGIPPGAVLGFLQLGLTSPGTPIGSAAPGCWQLTDGAVTLLYLLPVPAPTYGLTMPSGAAFVGLPINAQGGALVPGINALGLATSNGVRGIVGH